MIFIILVALVVVYLFKEMYWKGRNLPAGPTPLPLIGNFLSFIFCKQPGYDMFMDLKKKYGNVYTFWMGTTPFVLVCDYDVVKETIIKEGDKYENRFNQENFNKHFRGGVYGLIESNGERWREHRRFALHQLRNLGFAGSKMEKMVLAQVDDMSETLKRGKTSLEPVLQQAIGSLINFLICGSTIDERNKEDVNKMVAMITKSSKEFANPALMVFLSYEWLMKMPYVRRKLQAVWDLRDSIFEFFDKQISQHKLQVTNEEEDTIDYVDAYLKEQKKREAEGDYETFSKIQLHNMCLDLWLAGFDTTTATLMWSFKYLLHYPHVQVRMREELRTLVNSSETVTMAHRSSLPFCNAVVMESQRCLNLLPLNLARRCTEEVVVDGHVLPANTVVVPQISMLLLDEKYFPEPEKFKPERFIDEDGKLKKIDAFLPFSCGKRECPGKSMASMELFLIVSNIVNRFELTADTLPTLEKTFLEVSKPKAYDIIATPCS